MKVLAPTAPDLSLTPSELTVPRKQRPPSSSDVVSVDPSLLGRTQRFKHTHHLSERVVLLGLLLAELEDVPFEDVARLLDISQQRLEDMMRGNSTYPKAFAVRWEMLFEIMRNLHAVLRKSATGRWLHQPIPRLDGLTPLEAVKKGRSRELRDITRSYLEDSFS